MIKGRDNPFLLMLVYIRFLPLATRSLYPFLGKELHFVCGGGGGVQREGEDELC